MSWQKLWSVTSGTPFAVLL